MEVRSIKMDTLFHLDILQAEIKLDNLTNKEVKFIKSQMGSLEDSVHDFHTMFVEDHPGHGTLSIFLSRK